jgi:hypothetical protein
MRAITSISTESPVMVSPRTSPWRTSQYVGSFVALVDLGVDA